MKDSTIRAIKTFVQAFFGVLIPELCAVLMGGLPDLEAFKLVMSPVLCAALAAGISKAWNVINEKLKADEEKGE